MEVRTPRLEAMRIHCPFCGEALTEELVPLDSPSDLSEADGEDRVPRGRAFVEDGASWPQGRWCVNLADVVNLNPHGEVSRRNGCCGLDGLDGPNLLCASCNGEVATAKTDCWMPHGVLFEPHGQP